MYSYGQVEAIKTNLEWIVNQAALSHASPHAPIKKRSLTCWNSSSLTKYCWISEYGTDVIDTHIAEGLAVTEKFIAKVKNSAKAVNARREKLKVFSS
jgi:hypothetical protein